jgi:N-terminal half of MaoC dehydratase
MIDKKHIGKVFPLHTVEVEKSALRLFLKVIGETDPVYTDEPAARAAGHRSLLAPATFLFGLEMSRPNAFAWLYEIGANPARILHGEQSFAYRATVCAGDVITFETHLADIYDKKNGALEFILRKSRATNQDGQRVADLAMLAVHRTT